MTTIHELWSAYGGLIEVSGGLLSGWYGRIATTLALSRRYHLAAGQQALSLVDLLTARVRDQDAELAVLRRREWVLADAVQDVYAEAIAARLIVHDLDATAGRPLRPFRPLPPYPFPVVMTHSPEPDVSTAT